MLKIMPKNPTVWMMFECGGGCRWTSVFEDYGGEICTFSGCNCRTTVRKVKETTDRDEARNWFASDGRERPSL